MADNKSYTIGRQILQGEDLKIRIDYKQETFVLKYPTPLQRTLIENEIARRLGGMSRDSFSADVVQQVTAFTYVDNLIVSEESPSWFISAWDCLDEELIGTLFSGYLTFRSKIQEGIKTGRFERSRESGSS